jgi:ribosomal protein L28
VLASIILINKKIKDKKNMAKKCDLCGRGSTKGASRSHSKIKTLKRQNINLQTKNVAGMKFNVCTSCMRTMNKKEKEVK